MNEETAAAALAWWLNTMQDFSAVGAPVSLRLRQQERSRFDAHGWGPAEQAVIAALLAAGGRGGAWPA
jgi:hypothetical protein